MKKLLALVLALLLAFNLCCITAFAEAAEESGEFEYYDPEKLNVKKIGQIDGQETGEPEPMQYSDTDVLRVSIVLDGESTSEAGYSLDSFAENTEAVAYRDRLKEQQRRMTEKIEKKIGHELDVKWNLTLLGNVISANVTFADMLKIKSIEGVKEVFPEKRYQPQEVQPETAYTSENMVLRKQSTRLKTRMIS